MTYLGCNSFVTNLRISSSRTRPATIIKEPGKAARSSEWIQRVIQHHRLLSSSLSLSLPSPSDCSCVCFDKYGTTFCLQPLPCRFIICANPIQSGSRVTIVSVGELGSASKECAIAHKSHNIFPVDTD